MTQFYNNSVFWIEVDKIKPNPFQPRRDFDETELKSLADSIRQYGVLQALVVTRKEVPKDDGGISVEYELIAGERRLRASKIAGLREVPVLIKSGEEDDLMKLELAIIENIQREDLNALERAKAFRKLINQFNFSHAQVAEKVGKSRVYVSNTLRILDLPEEIQEALAGGKISEGHTRPLGMLVDRPEEQQTLLKEIIYKKLSVRDTEQVARRIAYDRVRKKQYILDPDIADMEDKLSESLGTRVSIDKRGDGGRISIDFFSNDDLRQIFNSFKNDKNKSPSEMLDKFVEAQKSKERDQAPTTAEERDEMDDRSEEQKKEDEDDEDLYSISNFSI